MYGSRLRWLGLVLGIEESCRYHCFEGSVTVIKVLSVLRLYVWLEDFVRLGFAVQGCRVLVLVG